MNFSNTKWLLTGGVMSECEITFHSDGSFSCTPEGQNYRSRNTWEDKKYDLVFKFGDLVTYNGTLVGNRLIRNEIIEIYGHASKLIHRWPPVNFLTHSPFEAPIYENFVLRRIENQTLSNKFLKDLILDLPARVESTVRLENSETKSTIANLNLSNTKWLVTKSAMPECEITFHSDGLFTYKLRNGMNLSKIEGNKWKVNENEVTFTFTDTNLPPILYIGALSRNQIIGTVALNEPYSKYLKFENFAATRIEEQQQQIKFTTHTSPIFQRIANTTWSMRIIDLLGYDISSLDDIIEITFNVNGTFTYKTYTGDGEPKNNVWKLEGEKITFEIDKLGLTYIGIIEGNRITGSVGIDTIKICEFEAKLRSSTMSPPWFNKSFKFQVCDIKRHPFSGEEFEINALSYYYAKNKYPNVPDTINSERKFVYDFKDGVPNTNYKAAIRIGSAIIDRFTPIVLNNKNTVCCIIPASTIEATYRRFYNFCEKISNLLGCTNGYEFIKVTKNSEASHLGGKARGDISNISISDSQIKDKTIYLFDDVITSGKTFVALANALREAGAKEVIGFFLAKTYDSRRLGEPNW
jgi:hypothetical protein